MITRDYIKWGVTHFPGPETFPEPPYLFESEASYLKKKKLLLKGELERIPKEDFEPKETYPFFIPDHFGIYSRVDDYQAILDKTREGYENGGSLDIKTFGLPESNYPDRFHIYENECKDNYYLHAGSIFRVSEERKNHPRVMLRNIDVKKYNQLNKNRLQR